jgi:hypothetical protein
MRAGLCRDILARVTDKPRTIIMGLTADADDQALDLLLHE